MTKFELLAASALAITIAAPAAAQTTTSADQTASDQVASGSVDQDSDYTSANDIVVTATRRNETVQEIPVAVTAVGAELLDNAGVVDIRGLEQLAPSLQTTTGQSAATGSSLSIRGIGTAGDNPGFEPAVGVFIDGVFRSRAGVALAELPELERVEILRGPQGTLFGRNTSAGALSIFTAQPQFDLGGYVEGSYGNYDAYEIKGALTGPVTEALALRVDGGYRKRDGYIKDANSDRAVNNIDRYYARGQALYDTAGFSFRLIGDYSETDEQCCGAINFVRGPTADAIDLVASFSGNDGVYSGPPSDRIQAISPNRDLAEKVRDWGVSGEFNVELGEFNLTSITAYRDWRALRNQDIDFSGIDRAYREGYRNELKDFTQELRFQGSAFDGAVDFLIGGFYLNETNRLRDTVRVGDDATAYVDAVLSGAIAQASGGALPTGAQFYGSLGPTVPLFSQVLLAQSPQLQAAAAANPALFAYLNTPLPGFVSGEGNNNDDFEVKTNAFAAFTHNIINFTDDLSLTLGLRYNYEKKDLTASINSNTSTCGFFFSQDPRAQILRGAIQQANPELYANFTLLSCNPAVSSEFNGNYADDRDESEFTGTAKLAYKLSDEVLSYISYDRGFKSGGYNLDQASFDTVLLGGDGAQATDLAFDKETVDAFELGVKMQPSNEFTFNAAVFYSQFKGLQSLIFAGSSFVVQNVPDATSKGVEAEAILQPVRELIFRLGYTYLDGSYDSSNDFTGTPLAGQEGEQFLNQPRHVVSMAGTWTPPITNTLNGLLHVDMRFNSGVNIACPNVSTTRPAGCDPRILGGMPAIVYNEPYPLIAARIGVQTDDRTKSLEFFVENLTNQYYNITGFAVPEQTGTFAGYPSTPRFYGVKARIGF
ncbi:TonB-dependent receptor [Sphingomonas japonica]|uniref:Outer membrane receptor protein involved in Fe transport n=1 Tax=Sphingomonas japonica TaxID=511662 RepID=A0ABX0U6A5_9SPHN|nr:TonB-dependent receptor [Sphingomonas japonica]NIJ24318.1 outer membrane receptor protein involved in Fe transport [Sphingomonas japonica]